MTTNRNIAPILMADDDVDDRMMAEKAASENRLANPFRTVNNGEELLDYLRHQGKFSDPATAPKPCLILLDLNMPKMDGREALRILKDDEKLRKIPVVIMTTSQAEEDILVSYNVGANSYITKPVTFDGLVKVIKTLKDYWLEIVELPEADGNNTSAQK
ncbi:MAG TPA: response regulator [bacterium]|jgi:CheY-like chemotaxis protein|nr:response regulator [bacterium]